MGNATEDVSQEMLAQRLNEARDADASYADDAVASHAAQANPHPVYMRGTLARALIMFMGE